MNDGGFGPWVEGLIMAEEHDRKILKPCPFCQSDNIQAFDIGRTFVLYCYECCSSGPEGKTLEDAIEKWNRRV